MGDGVEPCAGSRRRSPTTGVLNERRQQLHERTAAALETAYASSVENFGGLADHDGCTAIDEVVQYLIRASAIASRKSASAGSVRPSFRRRAPREVNVLDGADDHFAASEISSRN